MPIKADVLVRTAVPEDLSAMIRIQEASPEASQWHPRDYLQYEARVATVGQRVAGFLVWRTLTAGEYELMNLAVDPAMRRSGIARTLISAFLRAIRGDVFLEVRQSNTAARSAYKSMGFQEVSVRPQYYHTPPEAAIVMKFHSC